MLGCGFREGPGCPTVGRLSDPIRWDSSLCDQGWTWPLPPSGVSTYKGSGPKGPHPRQGWRSQCEEGALVGGP